jgi:glycerol kinase
MVNSTYGTGCFVLMNTGDNLIKSENGMLSTIAWKLNNEVVYAIEGSVFVGGSTVQWLRDGIKIIEDASETEAMAESLESNEGVYFVPAFVGLGTPYWDPKAKGAIFGLTRGTNESVIARSALEAICYQVQDVLYAMEADCKVKIPKVKANGGATINNFLMQFQSNIMNLQVQRPAIMETTALGAAYLAGLYVKYWKNHEDIMKYKKPDFAFQPDMDDDLRKELIRGWKVAVSATRNFKL